LQSKACRLRIHRNSLLWASKLT